MPHWRGQHVGTRSRSAIPIPSNRLIHYGICGEGLGHLSRAEVLVPRLRDAGYEVALFSSGRVARLLPDLFPGCRCETIRGLHFAYRDNAIALGRTALNYAGILFWWPSQGFRCYRRFVREDPLAVITDYEPVLARTARLRGLLHIAVGHQQIATETRVDWSQTGAVGRTAIRFFNRMIDASPLLRVIPSFFHPERIRSRGARVPRAVSLVGPLLRREVLELEPSRGDHIVVYQTADAMPWLGSILARLPGEKRVYGAAVQGDGVVARPMDRGAFLADLASCRFAVLNGGHTAITEALHFGKPVLALPVRGQTEQEINATHLEAMGFGRAHFLRRGEVPDVGGFVGREEEFRATIARDRLACGNDTAVRVILDVLRAREAVL